MDNVDKFSSSSPAVFWLSRSVALSYLAAFAIIGILVAYIGFCDPDTCWHLALGKWMFQHLSLPKIDPFSTNVFNFVHVSDQLPLMQHEWLSDLLFYTVLAITGLRGLLVFAAVLSAFSLAIVPALSMRKNDVPRVLILIAILWVVLASVFRLWVRPEQFSMFWFSLLIFVHNSCLYAGSRRKAFFCGVGVFSIMVLWTNMHALFLIGVAYCAVYGAIYCLVFSLRRIWGKAADTQGITPHASVPGRAILLSVIAAVATLFTPWQFALWRYMFVLLSSSATHTNKENGPLALSDLSHPTFWPLVLLLIMNWFLIISFINRRRHLKEKLRASVEPILLATAGLLIVCCFRRLTPLGLLVILHSVSKIFVAGYRISFATDVIRLADNQLMKLALPVTRASAPVFLALSAASCFLSATFLIKPVLPAESRLVVPPYKAMRYLQHHFPNGRLFNDSKYGSMMTWVMEPSPDIFIDGRTDSYDRNLVADYNTMRLCQPGWKSMLDRYKIKYVFFPPSAPIVVALSQQPGWRICYSDRSASILERYVASPDLPQGSFQSLVKPNQ